MNINTFNYKNKIKYNHCHYWLLICPPLLWHKVRKSSNYWDALITGLKFCLAHLLFMKITCVKFHSYRIFKDIVKKFGSQKLLYCIQTNKQLTNRVSPLYQLSNFMNFEGLVQNYCNYFILQVTTVLHQALDMQGFKNNSVIITNKSSHRTSCSTINLVSVPRYCCWLCFLCNKIA